MASFVDILCGRITKAIEELYQAGELASFIQLQKTKKEFDGDVTLVVFPLLRFSKKSPEETGREIGIHLKEKIPEIHNLVIIM